MYKRQNDERVRKIRWMVKKYGHRKGFKARYIRRLAKVSGLKKTVFEFAVYQGGYKRVV